MGSGDNQRVEGCLRIDVPEGYDRFIFIDSLRGNLSGGDFAEQTIRVHHNRLPLVLM